jgi:hypothetical protein
VARRENRRGWALSALLATLAVGAPGSPPGYAFFVGDGQEIVKSQAALRAPVTPRWAPRAATQPLALAAARAPELRPPVEAAPRGRDAAPRPALAGAARPISARGPPSRS